jgi:archaellum biogenesis ATPase FlaH
MSSHQIHPWLSWLIAFLQAIRPKFYNRLTWTIVISGLALTGSSLLSEVFRSVLEQKYQLIIPSTNPVYGIVLVSVGLCYHLAAHYLNERLLIVGNSNHVQSRQTHDLNLFKQFDEASASSY